MEEQTNTPTETSNSPMSPMVVVVGLGVIALLGVGYFLMKPNNPNTAATTTVAEGTMNVSPPMVTDSNTEGASDSAMNSEVRIIEVEAGSFYYKPNEIRVKKGEKVKVVMTSKDMMHNFVIDELNVKMPVTQSGNTATVEFTADTVGTFEFYCSVGQHRKLGQVGKLIVE